MRQVGWLVCIFFESKRAHPPSSRGGNILEKIFLGTLNGKDCALKWIMPLLPYFDFTYSAATLFLMNLNLGFYQLILTFWNGDFCLKKVFVLECMIFKILCTLYQIPKMYVFI